MTFDRRKRFAFESFRGVALAGLPLLSAALLAPGCSSDDAPGDLAPGPAPGATGVPTSRDASSLLDAGADVEDPTCLGDLPKTDAGTVCPEAGACAASCTNVTGLYKGGVAQAVAACVGALRSCNERAEVTRCLDEALARTCSDPSATPYCAPIVAACDPADSGSVISAEGCESFARGLNRGGRDTLRSCLTAPAGGGACTADIGACADRIRQ